MPLAHRTAPLGSSILVAAPYGRDAESLMTLLADEGYRAVVCDSLSDLVARIDDATGALLMTEEALVGGSGELKTRLGEQAAWSDIPLILLAASRSKQPMRREASQLEVLDLASNSVMLERPRGRSSMTLLLARSSTSSCDASRRMGCLDRLAARRISGMSDQAACSPRRVFNSPEPPTRASSVIKRAPVASSMRATRSLRLSHTTARYPSSASSVIRLSASLP